MVLFPDFAMLLLSEGRGGKKNINKEAIFSDLYILFIL